MEQDDDNRSWLREAIADGGDGNLHSGQVFCTSHDAAERRIIKALSGAGNCEFSGQLRD